ncbi:MAG: hypothetical protein ACRD0Y_10655 [Terriglobales bacterium]
MPHVTSAAEGVLPAADLPTVIAMAVLAGACATLLHEGLGHGGACVLSGGHNLVISTVEESCTLANHWIDAAGTLVNLAAGLIGWWWMHRIRRAARLRYFVWLLTAFNLLTGAGYFLFSGVGGLGDWAAVIAGQHPVWLWRTGLAVGGGVLYAAVLALLLHELIPFLPVDGMARSQHARRLMLAPYFTYGVLSVVAGLFNPVGAVLIAESAAAAAFGGVSGLWWGMPYLRFPRYGRAGSKFVLDRRSRGWIIAGAVVAVVFIAVIGPGVRP